jgi:hypothetical protein
LFPYSISLFNPYPSNSEVGGIKTGNNDKCEESVDFGGKSDLFSLLLKLLKIEGVLFAICEKLLSIIEELMFEFFFSFGGSLRGIQKTYCEDNSLERSSEFREL